ncbi:MAG: hypothetical protein IH629_01215, partial [Thermoleophilia bacterium]|nr:hypothetical protein [Thermoleophilia bacterium]
MSRFIRSALFPILIVIIVAMFIEWVISGNKADSPAKAIYAAPFVASIEVLNSDLQGDDIRAVVIDPANETAKVTQVGGVQYYVDGIADPAALQAEIETNDPDVSVSTGTVKPPTDEVASFTNDVVNGQVASV